MNKDDIRFLVYMEWYSLQERHLLLNELYQEINDSGINNKDIPDFIANKDKIITNRAMELNDSDFALFICKT